MKNESKFKPVRRPSNLADLIGISDEEAETYTLQNRLALISKLQAARRTEIERGKTNSWLYDMNRHLRLCEALRLEYEALTTFLMKNHPAASQDDSMNDTNTCLG